MTASAFGHGLSEVGRGCHAYLVPDGTWGLSNAGLIDGGDESLLVDTLFDGTRTRTMLSAMAGVTATSPVRYVVNTHANGDHWFGNHVLEDDVEVIASDSAAEEMGRTSPVVLETLRSGHGPAADFGRQIFGGFDWSDFTLRLPTRTLPVSESLQVGNRFVDLIVVGPAHTDGDVVVHVPDAGVVYTGDIVFSGGTPVVWAGPISSWVRACDAIVDLQPDVVVPGHGPTTDLSSVAAVRRYLEYVRAEALDRQDRGMTPWEAALDITLGEFADWPERGRLAQNVRAAYTERDPSSGAADPAQIFAEIGELERLLARP